jgi:hypothetical protein
LLIHYGAGACKCNSLYSSGKLFCYAFQVRVTNLQDASEHIGEVLKRVKKEHLQRAYKIKDWYAAFLVC